MIGGARRHHAEGDVSKMTPRDINERDKILPDQSGSDWVENHAEGREWEVSFRNFKSLSRHLSSGYLHFTCSNNINNKQQICRLNFFA